jgi:hypothetical protein
VSPGNPGSTFPLEVSQWGLLPESTEGAVGSGDLLSGIQPTSDTIRSGETRLVHILLDAYSGDAQASHRSVVHVEYDIDSAPSSTGRTRSSVSPLPKPIVVGLSSVACGL